MNLTNSSCLRILISNSQVLDDYLDDATQFTKVEFTGTYMTVDELYTATTMLPACDTQSRPIGTCDGDVYAYPELFNQEATLADGVYKIQIKGFYDDDSIVTEFACVFVDCETKCKVLEAQCIEATLWHYILTQSYSCNCSCDKLQDIWDALQLKLSNGCKEC